MLFSIDLVMPRMLVPEVGDADGAHSALVAQPDQCLPGLNVVLAGRQSPAQQVESDRFEPCRSTVRSKADSASSGRLLEFQNLVVGSSSSRSTAALRMALPTTCSLQ
ncbi:hypothetical protein IP83_05965 [Novosphingobium sp. AAP93]|nr:hypothetical protein IP83_05965 [Novosphingobium sp. AAP93]